FPTRAASPAKCRDPTGPVRATFREAAVARQYPARCSAHQTATSAGRAPALARSTPALLLPKTFAPPADPQGARFPTASALLPRALRAPVRDDGGEKSACC